MWGVEERRGAVEDVGDEKAKVGERRRDARNVRAVEIGMRLDLVCIEGDELEHQVGYMAPK
jgi:hypothetical protein